MMGNRNEQEKLILAENNEPKELLRFNKAEYIDSGMILCLFLNEQILLLWKIWTKTFLVLVLVTVWEKAKFSNAPQS